MKRNWFSNFLPFDEALVTSHGTRFVTPEHFYQANKTLDREWFLKIANASTPGKAKRLGRQVPIRADWDEIKLGVMEIALRWKFTSETTWGKRLMNTSGQIVEWNYWHDNFWGTCTCKKCYYIKGKNHLGKLLMKLRKEIAGY